MCIRDRGKRGKVRSSDFFDCMSDLAAGSFEYFEQIIGEADKETGKLPVVHPMTDKEVQISFNVTETKTGKLRGAY